MELKIIKSYILTIVLGVLLLAGLVLLALQWGNTCNFSMYGKNLSDANTGLVILISLAIGVALPQTLKILFRNVMLMIKARKKIQSS